MSMETTYLLLDYNDQLALIANDLLAHNFVLMVRAENIARID